MILYKYVDLCTGMKIVRNPSVKFTHPYNLNDPFEITSSFYETDDHIIYIEIIDQIFIS